MYLKFCNIFDLRRKLIFFLFSPDSQAKAELLGYLWHFLFQIFTRRREYEGPGERDRPAIRPGDLIWKLNLHERDDEWCCWFWLGFFLRPEGTRVFWRLPTCRMTPTVCRWLSKRAGEGGEDSMANRDKLSRMVPLARVLHTKFSQHSLCCVMENGGNCYLKKKMWYCIRVMCWRCPSTCCCKEVEQPMPAARGSFLALSPSAGRSACSRKATAWLGQETPSWQPNTQPWLFVFAFTVCLESKSYIWVVRGSLKTA